MVEKIVNALVPTGFGLNCDNETDYSLIKAGANSQKRHLNEIFDKPELIHDYHILVLGGGFSWADDHGAGHILGKRTKRKLGDHLYRFIDDGKLILGICNGSQAGASMGIVPGFDEDYQAEKVAFTYNDCGNFINQWVGLKVNPDTNCVFTKGIDYIEFTIRHGEGKFYADEGTLNRIVSQNQVVLQYCKTDTKELANGEYPANPNGSLEDIAGICDETGRILMMMPHPEAYNHFTNYPTWTRDKHFLEKEGKQIESREGQGVQIFRNAVEYIKENLL